jgi:hypothetical protein
VAFACDVDLSEVVKIHPYHDMGKPYVPLKDIVEILEKKGIIVTTEKFDPQKLDFGVYRIYWNTGGYSLASVGQTANGTIWFAPCNWTCDNNKEPNVASIDWCRVHKVELIEKV